MNAAAAGAVVIAAAVILSGCGKQPSSSSGDSTPGAPSTFTVRALTAERSGDHLHLTVAVHIKNPGTTPLTLTTPATQLWIGKDKPAAPFIGPGLEPAVIAPGSESDAATHWWLAGSDLSGSLELEIGGARQMVKTTGEFSPGSLVEGQPAPLSFPQWKTVP